MCQKSTVFIYGGQGHFSLFYLLRQKYWRGELDYQRFPHEQQLVTERRKKSFITEKTEPGNWSLWKWSKLVCVLRHFLNPGKISIPAQVCHLDQRPLRSKYNQHTATNQIYPNIQQFVCCAGFHIPVLGFWWTFSLSCSDYHLQVASLLHINYFFM